MGRSAPTSFIILDAQSVKTAENKGYDGGKKISGIKRHLAVDINGWPQAIHITTANVSERDGAVALLALNSEQFRLVKRVMADGGYTGENFAGLVQSSSMTRFSVVLPFAAASNISGSLVSTPGKPQNDLKHGRITPQRWVVERSFSWLDKCRRLWRNCERYLQTSRIVVALAFIRLLLKRY